MADMGGTRGQSEIIGAILLFAIVIGLLAINQAVLVPQNNNEIEFDHSKAVQSDMVNFRTGLIEAAASNEPRSASIALGTRYPTRYLAINPSPVSGTLETVDGGEITADEFSQEAVCGTGSNPVETKFVKYRPDYNYLGSAIPSTIEGSVAYRKGSGEALFDSRQILIRDNQITLIPVIGDVQTTAIDTTTVDLLPSETGRTTVTGSDPVEITLPTELSQSDWDSLLAPEISNGHVQSVSVSGGTVTIELDPPDTAGNYAVRCTTVGINEQPDVSPTVGSPPGPGGPGPGFINPVGPGTVSFERAELESNSSVCGGGDCQVDVTLENHRSSDVKIVEARFVYYGVDSQGQAGNSIDPPDEAEYAEHTPRTTFEILGPEEPVDGDTISGSSTEEIRMFFFNSGPGAGGGGFDVDEGDWYVLRLTFEDQSSGDVFSSTYFIPPET